MAEEDEQSVPAEANIRQRRKVFETVEFGTVPVPIEDLIINGKLSVYPAVTGQDFFQFNVRKENLLFKAGGVIGLIPINDKVVLDIRPKVPVKNLNRILLISDHPPEMLKTFQREYSSDDHAIPSLIDILTTAFLESLVSIEQYGVYRDYVRVNRDTSFPRGRIEVGRTIQRHFAVGRKHAVTASWFEPTADQPVNRLLKYVVWMLAEKYRLVNPQKGWKNNLFRLNYFYRMFERAHLDKSKSFLKDRLVSDPKLIPDLRSYYLPAVLIAKTIIEERGISLDRVGDDILLPSLFLKMDDVFEKYVRAVLKGKVDTLNSPLSVLDGNKTGSGGGQKPLFDQPTGSPAKPDIVFRYQTDKVIEFPIVIDTKYKGLDKPQREDLNQVIAYGFSYRAPRAILIHPRKKGGPKGLHLLGTIDKLSVYQYSLDLESAKPEEGEEEMFKDLLGLVPQIKKPASV